MDIISNRLVEWTVALFLAIGGAFMLGRLTAPPPPPCTKDHPIEPSHMAVPTLDHQEAPKEEGAKV
jgi:hypothetical protein